MKRPRVPEVVSVLLVLATLACAMSQSARATRMAETEEALGIEALIQTSTAAALATDTPAPTGTILVPPGMGFAPELIGMDLDEAQRLLERLDFRYIWVPLINRAVPEWQVYEQEPLPGELMDIEADRLRLCVAVYEFTPTSSGGGGVGGACNIPPEKRCEGTVLQWCEGNTLRERDCADCCGVCVWYGALNSYNCSCWC